MPSAAFDATAFNGRSRPMVGLDVINGVPIFRDPKISKAFGAKSITTLAAPLAWFTRAKTLIPLRSIAMPRRSRVLVTPKSLCFTINPSSAPVAGVGVT